MSRNVFVNPNSEVIKLPPRTHYVEHISSVDEKSTYPGVYHFLPPEAISQFHSVVDILDRAVTHILQVTPEDRNVFMHFFPWLRSSKNEFLEKAQKELRVMSKDVRTMPPVMPTSTSENPSVIVTNSHANDSILLSNMAIESDIPTSHTAIIVFDRHIDTVGNNGKYVPSNRACGVSSILEEGFGKVAIIGVDYRDIEGNSRLTTYPESKLKAIPFNSPKKPVQSYVDDLIESYASDGITNVVFSIDLDVLNLWRERISATLYSPYDTLATYAFLDPRKMKKRIADHPSSQSSNIEESLIIDELIGFLSGNVSVEEIQRIIELTRDEYGDALDYLMKSDRNAGSAATFSGLATVDLLRSISFIKRKCAEKGITVGFGNPDGTQFYGTITEFYPDAPDIQGNTAKTIYKISEAMQI